MRTRTQTLKQMMTGIALAAALTIPACNGLDATLDGFLGKNAMNFADQGYVHFDDTGNIQVIFNNLEFHNNPLWNSTSYIGVFVFPRGADPFENCCDDGFEDHCTSIQEKSCLTGVGFSNDLGYGGTFYLSLHPPEAFNTQAPRFYMDVYVSDKQGIPQNYQGEYNHFSSPVNAVGDREVFDMYIGAYYSVADQNGNPGFRPVNLTGTTKIDSDDVTYYSQVRPDYLSPLIRIESRFYKESPQDPTGSWYPIPHLASWTRVNAGASFNMSGLVINEVGIDGTGDFIEIHNPTGRDVNLTLAGARIMRDSGCNVGNGITTSISLTGTLSAGGYYVIARTGHTLLNVDQTTSSNLLSANNGDCIILVNSTSSPDGPSSGNVVDWLTLAGGTGTKENGVEATDPGTVTSASRCPNGTDTNTNNSDFNSTTARTPGLTNTCP